VKGQELRSSAALAGLGLTIAEAAEAMGAAVSAPGDNRLAAKISGVATDSRAAGPGLIFFALKGERVDGHEYLAKAAAAGAVAAVVRDKARIPSSVSKSAVLLRTPDTTTALGQLAAMVRKRVAPVLAAVTGTSGKTTVKELLRSALVAAAGDPAKVLSTSGNLNNHVGLPLTLLSMGPETRLAVVEMGASAPGEIEYLTALAKPDVGVVTMAGAAHLEGFGSLAGVAKAKGELYLGLSRGAVAVVNSHDGPMVERGLRFPGNKLYFGLADLPGPVSRGRRRRSGLAEPQVRAAILRTQGLAGQRLSLSGPGLGAEGLTVDLKLPGRHNALNAAAAAAAALAMGLEWEAIGRGLAEAGPVAGRLAPSKGVAGYRLIDDSYNANPDSMAAALEFLTSLTGTKAAILGDMLELGEESEAAHRRIGSLASRLDHLALVGPAARLIGEAALSAGLPSGRAGFFDDALKAAAWAAKAVQPGAAILIKGSRAMGLERAVARLSVPSRGEAERS
jgi:UDP-N-acetylmuramoyl-tripeptide--D-alanyl-D-alanine ligase